ncbi:MAG: tryptophan synthase subunit beta [Candidatus Muiribacterium halophilum]|uniref:Tryptophan synthase beta chain n=1 Tax=Muiribacterium halophilum TaxID=2053465 RepID=A0A2N5ZGI1_MUIH1|nr:MAG: tryptophan synthase subunit beta [Candidatus Muirbacterium halophilum]
MEGYFGDFGGSFVPPIIKENLDKLYEVFKEEKDNREFKAQLEQLLKDYSGRPTPLYLAENLSKEKGAKIYLKREDLNHIGAHKINNTLGQALLAQKMGKKKLVAETGAGMHGVAVATVAAKFNMECIIFQGALDVERQDDNARRMKALGAKIVPVHEGEQTLKEAVDAAIGYWVENANDTFYMLGSAVGPHPYPEIVRYFQSVIGNEAKKQIISKEGRLPDKVVACIGGGSNAIGIFSAFIEDESVKLVGVEAAGEGLHTNRHAATLTKGRPGVLHGMKTFVIQDDNDEISPVYSIAAGLDYPGIGPEISHLFSKERLTAAYCDDKDAVDALFYLSKKEGIIPAIESAHAISWVLKNDFKKDEIVIINLSGRGDKDLARIL